jgi:hypothetical protein
VDGFANTPPRQQFAGFLEPSSASARHQQARQSSKDRPQGTARAHDGIAAVHPGGGRSHRPEILDYLASELTALRHQQGAMLGKPI